MPLQLVLHKSEAHRSDEDSLNGDGHTRLADMGCYETSVVVKQVKIDGFLSAQEAGTSVLQGITGRSLSKPVNGRLPNMLREAESG